MCEWNERATRPTVKSRSGGICELCQRARGDEMHHRHSRGTGGRWSPANILHLCWQCHRWATNPSAFKSAAAAAYIRGVCLRHGDDAETTPVVRDDGTQFQPTDDLFEAGRYEHLN